MARYRKEKLGQIDYSTADYLDLCLVCHKEKATHGKVCDSCYAKLGEMREKRRKPKNHYWFQENKMLFAKSARGT